MSKTEIIAELLKMSRRERILDLEDKAQLLELRRRAADQAFQMLDSLEAQDADH